MEIIGSKNSEFGQVHITPRLLDHTTKKINMPSKKMKYPKCSRRETEKVIDALITSWKADAKTLKIMKVTS